MRNEARDPCTSTLSVGMSKRKTVGIMRRLKKFYATDATLNDARVREILRVLRDECGESVDGSLIWGYFSDRAYRAKRNASRGRYVKTPRDKEALQAMWACSGGKCPPRSDRNVVRALEQSGSMTYDDIQQWFGQRRHAERKRCRHVVEDPMVHDDAFDLPTCQPLPWVNAHDCDVSPVNCDVSSELLYHSFVLFLAST